MRGFTLNLSSVLIISYHFYPSNEIGARRLTALAKYLTNNGIRVTVVSAFDNRPFQRGDELLPSIFAIPVRPPARALLNTLVGIKKLWPGRQPKSPADVSSAINPATLPGNAPKIRARDVFFRTLYFVDEYKKWAWLAARAAIAAGRRRKHDLVFASGPPHSGLAAAAYAARALRVPFVADLRDPWSDYLEWYFRDRGAELNLLRRLERLVLRNAAAITSTGATVAARLVDRDPSLIGRVHVVRNGFDGIPVVSGTGTGGKLSILFAGELYVGRNPFPFLAALESLLANPAVDPSRIDVTFMGKVEAFRGQSLAAWLDGKRSQHVVTIVPPQPAEAVALAASRATVLLNLAQRQYLSVPAKTFEHLASGREILLVCENDCETALLVAGIQGVNQVDPADPTAFARVLEDLYQRHVNVGELIAPSAREFEQFSRESANRAFLQVLRSVVS